MHRILSGWALLADDHAEEAVQELRHLLASDAEPGLNSLNPGQMNALLARLGVYLEKPEWTAEGIKGAREWLAKEADKNAPDEAHECPHDVGANFVRLEARAGGGGTPAGCAGSGNGTLLALAPATTGRAVPPASSR